MSKNKWLLVALTAFCGVTVFVWAQNVPVHSTVPWWVLTGHNLDGTTVTNDTSIIAGSAGRVQAGTGTFTVTVTAPTTSFTTNNATISTIGTLTTTNATTVLTNTIQTANITTGNITTGNITTGTIITQYMPVVIMTGAVPFTVSIDTVTNSAAAEIKVLKLVE